jgi:hypothetical protein
MAPSSGDRLSVDLHGLKSALIERARLAGTSYSGWVRATLAEALGGSAEPAREARPPRLEAPSVTRVRLTLRMPRAEADAALAAARLAGQPAGDFVADTRSADPVRHPCRNCRRPASRRFRHPGHSPARSASTTSAPPAWQPEAAGVQMVEAFLGRKTSTDAFFAEITGNR